MAKKSSKKPAAPAPKPTDNRALERRVTLLIVVMIGLLAAFAWMGGSTSPVALFLSDLGSAPADRLALSGRQIGVISGHRDFDSGAICDDGRTEVATIARIAERVQQRLQRAGATVEMLGEYDPRLNGYTADALISIHADSCIERSGFKVARWADSAMPAVEDHLVTCLSDTYAAATGLIFDFNTVTNDMTQYHAFRRAATQTPGAIIEVGYLGGDWALIGEQPATAADGIVDGLVCFFQPQGQ